MDFDENKKLEVEVSQNDFVENRVETKRRRRGSRLGIDALDMAIVPVALGVFVSLGFLFANLFKATAAVDAVARIANALSSIL